MNLHWLNIAVLTLSLTAVILFTLALRSRRREMREMTALMHPVEPAKVLDWFSVTVLRIFTFLFAIFRVWQQPKQKGLPAFAQIFLLFLSRRNREHIIGDLEEEYRTSQKRFPRCWYWGQVFALLGRYWWAGFRRLASLDVIQKLIRK
jgi:hypothetical protein